MIVSIKIYEINKIIDILKSLKSDIIMCTNGITYGTCENNVYINYINDIKIMNDLTLSNVGFYFSDFRKIISSLPVINPIEDSVDFDKNNLLLYYNGNIIYRFMSSKNFINHINSAMYNIDNDPCVKTSHINIHEEDKFRSILNKKTKDGNQIYKKDNLLMSIYTGLLNINKSDAVDLELCNPTTKNYFYALFKVHKKGKPTVHTLIKYLRLVRLNGL